MKTKEEQTMAVTIKDVAAAAGVSPSTVSRTCKDSPSISRETKERVRRIMAQLGYVPNFETEPVGDGYPALRGRCKAGAA